MKDALVYAGSYSNVNRSQEAHMIGTIILILVGLLLFKLAGGLGTLFAIAVKILGVMMIIGAIFTLIESI